MNALRRTWQRAHVKVRWGVVLLLGVVALNVFAFTADAVFGRGPAGPASSSYATAPNGVAAYAELLSRSGHVVTRLRVDPSAASLDPTTTLAVLDPPKLPESEPPALRDFVVRGGRLIVGTSRPAPWLAEIIEHPPAWYERGTEIATPIAPVAENGEASEVTATGRGGWRDSGATLPLLGGDDVTIATVASVGRGRIVFLADVSVLANRSLASADNAAFALAIVGAADRRVVFAESFHGYREASGISALPARWRWSLAGLAIAGAVWTLARGRRLGPPDVESRPLPPARRAYVDALATTLARTGPSDAAVASIKDRARRVLAQRAALAPDASDEALTQAAERLGLPVDERRALFNVVTTDADVIATARAFVTLSNGNL